MLRGLGEREAMSSGTQRPAILGNELYTSPASSPATNAPAERERKRDSFLVITAIVFLVYFSICESELFS